MAVMYLTDISVNINTKQTPRGTSLEEYSGGGGW